MHARSVAIAHAVQGVLLQSSDQLAINHINFGHGHVITVQLPCCHLDHAGSVNTCIRCSALGSAGSSAA